ncbi:MAG: HlyC/CorC family transporter [Anaerolineales bacterium]|nr:HlyC/CorC family transporter [Anaerolineales bacterium]
MIVFIIILLLIFFNALYVSAEFSSVSARKTRIYQLADEGNRFALMLRPVLMDSHRLDNYIAACQLGITASSLVLGFYGKSQLSGLFIPLLDILGIDEAAAESVATSVVLLILTTLQVLLGELVPKSVGVRYPEKLALATVIPMRWTVIIMRPFTWLFNGTGRLILSLLKVPLESSEHHVHEPDEIERLVAESAMGGQIELEEKEMLRNVFRLSDMVARQVMIPRNRIEAAPIDIDSQALLSMIADSSYTRIPIYNEDIDHIVGMVHLKDIFHLCIGQGQPEVSINQLLRQVIFVPETMPVDELWALLKSGHHYMAIVFDEYGGTSGLVTQEDLIEEIFGELQDEFDQEIPLIALEEGNNVVIRGDVLVEDVNEYLLMNLPIGQADSIGGLVVTTLGRRPQVGDSVQFGSNKITVHEINDLAVTQVGLTLPEDAKAVLGIERARRR